MASFSLLLLLSTALIHTAQSLPAARNRGRGLDLSVGGARRQRRDLHDLLPYEEQMMSSYPAAQVGGGANDLYYQSDDWRGRGLDHALQRLVEKDQRREQEEEQRAAYLAALLRLLNEAESAGLVGPGDVEVMEEEEHEEDQGPQGGFQGPTPQDYDETERSLEMERPTAAWWGLMEPQVAQALLDRMGPQVAQALLERARQERLQQTGRNRGVDPETLRRLVARLMSSIGPNNPQVMSPGRRLKRDVSFTALEPVNPVHRRTRRSLDDLASPSPSNAPLLRVKRLEEKEEEEEKLRPAATTSLQRMKRIDAMATSAMEELHHGNRRRRRRAALIYDPQILINQIVEYMRE